jgi:hypothetical protein
MALEGTADVDEKSVVLDGFATDDEWGGSVHVVMSGVVVVARDQKANSPCRERGANLSGTRAMRLV